MTADPRAFPWEAREPDFNAYGFMAVRGTVQIYLGYAVFGNAVLLYCNERIADNQTRQWLRFWTTRESAIEQAEGMCSDVEDYLMSYGHMPARPIEDLDMDDFINHLKARLNDELH